MFLDHIDVALKFQYKALVQQRNEMLSPLYTAYAVNSFKFIAEAAGDVFETRCMSTFSSEEQKYLWAQILH